MLVRSARESTPLLAYLDVSSELCKKIAEQAQKDETSDQKDETTDLKGEVSKQEEGAKNISFHCDVVNARDREDDSERRA